MKFQRKGGSSEGQSKSRAPAKKKSRGGMVLGLFIGLVIGVAIAFGVVWYLNKMPNPFQGKGGKGADPAIAGQPAPAVKSTTPGAPQSLGGKPGDKAPDAAGDKPRFEFYKILPGGQEATPGQAPAPGASAEKPVAAPAEPQSLQVGAFQKPADADNLKAKLALMGLEASVEPVDVPEKGKMHRVRLGPYAKLEELNRVRNLLSQNGIQATIVKAGKTTQ